MGMNDKNFLGWLRGDNAGDRCDDGECACACGSLPPQTEDEKQKKKKEPQKYTDLTDDDIKYIEAVRRGDEKVYGPMIKRAFFKAFPNTAVRDEVWRRDKSCDFTEFKLKRKVKSDAGWLGEGVYFYGAYDEAMKAYGYGWCLRPFFINVTRPYSIEKPTHDAIAKANASGVSHEVTTITKDFDGVFYNGEMKEEWCVRDPHNVKIAEATYDDHGQIIPLSYRFKADNPDFRF